MMVCVCVCSGACDCMYGMIAFVGKWMAGFGTRMIEWEGRDYNYYYCLRVNECTNDRVIE